jgi:hypothetical protein
VRFLIFVKAVRASASEPNETNLGGGRGQQPRRRGGRERPIVVGFIPTVDDGRARRVDEHIFDHLFGDSLIDLSEDNDLLLGFDIWSNKIFCNDDALRDRSTDREESRYEGGGGREEKDGHISDI